MTNPQSAFEITPFPLLAACKSAGVLPNCVFEAVQHDPAMLVVLVQVRTTVEAVEGFKAATKANASASRQEPGIARFDVIQQADDPTRFVLIEVYRTPEAAVAHKETAHYKTWRDTVASMMAEPRAGVKYSSLDPADAEW